MKPLERIRTLFRGHREPPTPIAESIPEPPVDQPEDDRPEWRKKIDWINGLCEERKLHDRMLQGGRVVTVPPSYESARLIRPDEGKKGGASDNGDRPS
jgi:hypothetical protein